MNSPSPDTGPIDQILPQVQTPAQYIGSEYGAVRKDWGTVDVHVALAFPDTYAVGMSHLGLFILYHIVNEMPKALAERVFAPWSDMEEKLRERGFPLFSIESQKPLNAFDIVGFSLQYELCYSNVLNMLDLGGIPLLSRDRSAGDPLVIAGGPCATSPEPLADFIDVFIVGDGEEALPRLVDEYAEWKKAGVGDRREILHHIAQTVPGAYVPSLYKAVASHNGFLRVVPIDEAAPEVVQAAIIPSLEEAPFPTRIPVPFVQIVHDRIAIEIMRGCTQGCRFCHAGMIRRPIRLRSVETIRRLANELYRNTGYDEIALASLSTGDYPFLAELLRVLNEDFNDRRVNIALPSLRIDAQLEIVPARLSVVRKSGLTIAVEAATDRLRAVINKNIRTDDLFRMVRAAYEAGWRTVKLYFMVGLPTERDEDVLAIPEISRQVSNLRKETGKGRANVNVTVSPFVPKPHTPFQWLPMARAERLEEIRRMILGRRIPRSVKINMHNTDQSFLEAVFARGDRRLGRVLLRAHELGCKLDAWSEHFDSKRWMTAFRQEAIDPEAYAHGEFEPDEPLPWQHIRVGVSHAFLKRELDRARRAERTLDCAKTACHNCGLPFCERRDALSRKAHVEPPAPSPAE